MSDARSGLSRRATVSESVVSVIVGHGSDGGQRVRALVCIGTDHVLPSEQGLAAGARRSIPAPDVRTFRSYTTAVA
jgi:hypothetical protein